MIDAAAGDPTALKMVVSLAKKVNPGAVVEIDARVARLKAVAAAAQTQKLAHESLFQGITGNVQIGASTSTGNTRSTGLSLGAELKKQSLHWKHALTASADYERDSGITTKERYFAGYEGNYQFSKRFYALGVFSYERDRFAGFTSRFSEAVGLGYPIVDRSTLQIGVEGGPALRQTNYIGHPNQNTPAARLAGNLAWTIYPGAILSEDVSSYIESNDTTVTSQTALTAKLFGALSGRISYRVINESNPPPGLKTTDTFTNFSLVYGF